MNQLDSLSQKSVIWDYFNPFSQEFKEAEKTFHELIWWRQALVVSACVVGGLFFIVGAFPVFCWTVKVLSSHENEKIQSIGGVYREHVAPEQEENIEMLEEQNAFDQAVFQAFRADPIVERNRGFNRIKMCFIGVPFLEDQRVLIVVKEYLEQLFNLHLEMAEELLPLALNGQRRMGGRAQVELREQWRALGEIPHENTFLMGCTNQDLYPREQGWYFTLGGASKESTMSILSLNRLYNQEEDENNKVFIRAMKLAAGQLGTMRGLDFCERNCCGNWIRSVQDLDRASLNFCPQDMVKISHFTGLSVRELYQRQLQFFEQFNVRYQEQNIHIDFRREISYLSEKLRII